jgi:hypothetical protein
MIKKDFFLAKDNYRIGAQILRDHGGEVGAGLVDLTHDAVGDG